MSAARNLAGVASAEGVDRLAATATSLRGAVATLRRLGQGAREGDADGEAAVVAGAKTRALGAVRDLAGLLASQVSGTMRLGR